MNGFPKGKIPGKQRESHTEGHKQSGSPHLALMRRQLGGYTAGIFPGFAAAPEQNNCELHNTRLKPPSELAQHEQVLDPE